MSQSNTEPAAESIGKANENPYRVLLTDRGPDISGPGIESLVGMLGWQADDIAIALWAAYEAGRDAVITRLEARGAH